MEDNRYFCEVCNHRWFPRSFQKPKQCPNCKSTKWETGGTYRKRYYFEKLQVGDEALYHWYSLLNGDPDIKSNVMLNKALAVYQCKTGKKFTKKATSKGLLVRRIA